VGRVLIWMYLGKATVASTWGAAGSLVVLLIWVYYSTQIFFLGAEFTRAWAQSFGSRPCDRVNQGVQITPTVESAEKNPPPASDRPGLITVSSPSAPTRSAS